MCAYLSVVSFTEQVNMAIFYWGLGIQRSKLFYRLKNGRSKFVIDIWNKV